MSLGEFLGEKSGSWADDTEGLPTHSTFLLGTPLMSLANQGYVADHRESSTPLSYDVRDQGRSSPRTSGPSRDYPSRSGGDYPSRSGGDYPSRSGGDYPRNADSPSTRQSKPIPQQPPYTAFVGNLPFGITEADLEDFFHPLELTNVRLNRDETGRLRGFGYVEFKHRADIEEVMSRAGEVVSIPL
jgi:hypothetical protein